jgi:hypothetical protein
MPRASQTVKMKVHKDSNLIPSLLKTKVSTPGKASARQVIKAKVHRKKK